ncbi:MerR family transcriptional regulator [Enterococcus faecium]|uniref:MerR family transcriptional regulator n=1 Tax=Enterococcus faecium TaxID=1352 RepID=UPI0030C90E71
MKKYRFKVSELADLLGINKRTLHYYDEIGLFSPDFKDDNGYRYYSVEKSMDLAIILSFKELAIPLEEIKQIIDRDMWHSKTILESKIEELDKQIDSLKEIKQLATRKLKQIKITERGFFNIEEMELQEEHMVLSEVLETDDLLTIFNAAYQLLNDEGKYLFTNNRYGYMIHSNKKILNSRDEIYDYFFLEKDQAAEGTYVKPAGHYLTMLYSGAEAELYKAYDKIQKYVSDKQYELTGYFYEFPIHQSIHKKPEAFITEIQVKFNQSTSD